MALWIQVAKMAFNDATREVPWLDLDVDP
jgi:hypothetical protein